MTDDKQDTTQQEETQEYPHIDDGKCYCCGSPKDVPHEPWCDIIGLSYGY